MTKLVTSLNQFNGLIFWKFNIPKWKDTFSWGHVLCRTPWECLLPVIQTIQFFIFQYEGLYLLLIALLPYDQFVNNDYEHSFCIHTTCSWLLFNWFRCMIASISNGQEDTGLAFVLYLFFWQFLGQGNVSFLSSFSSKLTSSVGNFCIFDEVFYWGP